MMKQSSLRTLLLWIALAVISVNAAETVRVRNGPPRRKRTLMRIESEDRSVSEEHHDEPLDAEFDRWLIYTEDIFSMPSTPSSRPNIAPSFITTSPTPTPSPGTPSVSPNFESNFPTIPVPPRPIPIKTPKPIPSPTISPTTSSTIGPSRSLSREPTRTPTRQPTLKPSRSPTMRPTTVPTSMNSIPPTEAPTRSPTKNPAPSISASPSQFLKEVVMTFVVVVPEDTTIESVEAAFERTAESILTGEDERRELVRSDLKPNETEAKETGLPASCIFADEGASDNLCSVVSDGNRSYKCANNTYICCKQGQGQHFETESVAGTCHRNNQGEDPVFDSTTDSVEAKARRTDCGRYDLEVEAGSKCFQVDLTLKGPSKIDLLVFQQSIEESVDDESFEAALLAEGIDAEVILIPGTASPGTVPTTSPTTSPSTTSSTSNPTPSLSYNPSQAPSAEPIPATLAPTPTANRDDQQGIKIFGVTIGTIGLSALIGLGLFVRFLYTKDRDDLDASVAACLPGQGSSPIPNFMGDQNCTSGKACCPYFCNNCCNNCIVITYVQGAPEGAVPSVKQPAQPPEMDLLMTEPIDTSVGLIGQIQQAIQKNDALDSDEPRPPDPEQPARMGEPIRESSRLTDTSAGLIGQIQQATEKNDDLASNEPRRPDP